MYDRKKLEWALKCCKSLSQGVNPISGDWLEESDIANNSHVSNCMEFIAEVLQDVLNGSGGGEVRQRSASANKVPFSLTHEQMEQLQPSEEELSISRVVAKINELIDRDTMSNLKSTAVNKWLVSVGLLKDVKIGGNIHKRPTETGLQMGIKVLTGTKDDGSSFQFVAYPPNIQLFIFDNIDQITVFAHADDVEIDALREQKKANDTLPWTDEDDNQLRSLVAENTSLKTMSDILVRRQVMIKRRMIKLGLIDE